MSKDARKTSHRRERNQAAAKTQGRRRGGGCRPGPSRSKGSIHGMKFRVGSWIYRVQIVRGWLYHADGRAAALWLWDERVLQIAGALNVACRIDALIHELRHAWQNHFGTPKDAEGDANNASSFTLDFMRQFLAQGGEDALMAMEAE